MKKLLALLLALTMLFALAACGTGTDTDPEVPDSGEQSGGENEGGSTSTDNVVRMGLSMKDMGNLNSLLTTYNTIFQTSDCIFDQLIMKDPFTLELKPNLITDFPEISEDGTLFTFELKQGVINLYIQQ